MEGKYNNTSNSVFNFKAKNESPKNRHNSLLIKPEQGSDSKFDKHKNSEDVDKLKRI
jgi:hypothetical protein